MSPFAQFGLAGKLVVASAIGVVAVASIAALVPDDPDIVVTHIVDGDTIDVTIDGDEQRIRLLNVDTPESVDPRREPECLGNEATAFLADLLPIGSEVTLEYDQERQDRYGRDLAGVFIGDVLVNAEIARAGMGAAVLFEPNDRFYDDVLAAQQTAQVEELGLFDLSVGCTVPAQTAAFATLAETTMASQPAQTDVAVLEQYGTELAAALAVGVAVTELLDGDTSRFPLLPFAANADGLREQSTEIRTNLEGRVAQNTAAIAAEQSRLEAERIAAEEEAARVAAEEAERVAAQEEAERIAADEAARQDAQEETESHGDSNGSGGGSGTSDGGDTGGNSEGGSSLPSDAGYNGCRDYSLQYTASAIDSEGRAFTKIDCTTKLPLG